MIMEASKASRWSAICAVSCWFVEPEVEFEPTTFRLRVGFSASTWMAPDGSRLLRLDASSVQTAPDGSRPIVWMIIGMINAHPTQIGWQGKRTDDGVLWNCWKVPRCPRCLRSPVRIATELSKCSAARVLVLLVHC
jgi:hypothetical protein